MNDRSLLSEDNPGVVGVNDRSLPYSRGTVSAPNLSNADPKSEISPDTDNKAERSMQELSVVKREARRARRLTVFKRVTSMENLRNHKERQRQYIKKNGNTKHDAVEKDVPMSSEGGTSEEAVGVSAVDSESSYLECPQCDRRYSSKKSLERHASTHDEKKFKCEKCKKRFMRMDELLRHGKRHEGSNEKSSLVPCKICDKSFRKTYTMVRHLNVHKRVNPKEVFSILKEIRDRRKLENDARSLETIVSVRDREAVKADVGALGVVDGNDSIGKSTKLVSDAEEKIDDFCTSGSDSNSDNKSDSFDNVPLYRCEHCAKRYTAERSLRRHLLIHDEKKFVCNVCNMKFFRQDRLKSHRDRYGHDEGKDSSSIPQKPLDDKSAIKLINSWIREELDSDNEGKGFPCEICGKSYDTKKSLSKHQTNAHAPAREESHGCTSCDKECRCAVEFKGTRKNNDKANAFACAECNKTFEKEIKLQRHMRVHERAKEQQDSNFKRFLCHICSKTFRQNTGLMFHMRTHTGYKPHVCKYCGRGFTSNSNCINHERTHTGDRPFVCHFCSAAFAKSCTLKAHITTHTGEANYHCKTCGKSFRRLKYLKEHRFTHTGEKPYACKICGTAYSHSGSLFVHEKKCKAQYNNYQAAATPTQNTQNYREEQPHRGNVCENATPLVSPIISTLPQSNLNDIAASLDSQGNKSYMESVQRMNAHTSLIDGTPSFHLNPDPDVTDVVVPSPVRNVAIVGQVFYS